MGKACPVAFVAAAKTAPVPPAVCSRGVSALALFGARASGDESTRAARRPRPLRLLPRLSSSEELR
eukprot:2280838-Alexandrium_andersonii.AAC.1